MSIDTSPKRLRELADEALCNTAFVPKEVLLAIAAEKEAAVLLAIAAEKEAAVLRKNGLS